MASYFDDPSASGSQADGSGYNASQDDHLERDGTRVPTPDPKDQTGDPEEPNPAMRELRERKGRNDDDRETRS
jgi:hypothetical protein